MKTFMTLLLLASGALTFAQEKTATKESDLVRLYAKSFSFEGKDNIIMHDGGTKLRLGKHMTVEADSATFDTDRDLLITYGTRRVTFNDRERSFTEDNDTRIFYLASRPKSD